MDPNSKLAQSVLHTSSAILAIHRWFAKGHSYYWAAEPETVIAELRAQGPTVTYMKAVEILSKAETSKLPGGANAGMSWIKQEWKQYVFWPE